MRLRGPSLRLTAMLAGLGISLVVLGISVTVGNNIGQQTAKASASYQTIFSRRGALEATVTAPGVVTANKDVNLTFQVNGVVNKVSVNVGQIVKKDDPLAQLDTRELELNVSLNQAHLKEAQSRLEVVKTTSAKDLITAEANLRQAKARLEQVRNGNSTNPQINIAKAELDRAQADYDKLVGVPNANDIAAADATLKQAKANLEILKAGPDGQALKKANAVLDAATQNFGRVKSDKANAKEQARINRDLTQKTFEAADVAYKKIVDQNHNPDGTFKANLTQAAQDAETKAKADLDKAKADYDKAKADYDNASNQETLAVNEAQALIDQSQADLDKLKAGVGVQAIIIGEAEVDKAQAFLNKAKQGPTRDQIAAAQADLNKAKANLDKLNGGGTDKDLTIAQADVDKAQAVLDDLNKGPKAAELSQAQAGVDAADSSLKQAQLKLDQGTLKAPFDGVISSVNVMPGQSVGFVAAGAATSVAGTVGMVDMSNLSLNLTVNESDITRLKLDQDARINLDAVGKDQLFLGKVSFISPKPSPLTSNTNGYQVTVKLDYTPGSSSPVPTKVGVKPGMSGSVKLIVDRRNDILLVDNKALKKLGTDTIVEVLDKNGQLFVVPVATGVTGEKETEILEPSLLRPNDQLVLGIALDSSRGIKEALQLHPTLTPEASPAPKN